MTERVIPYGERNVFNEIDEPEISSKKKQITITTSNQNSSQNFILLLIFLFLFSFSLTQDTYFYISLAVISFLFFLIHSILLLSDLSKKKKLEEYDYLQGSIILLLLSGSMYVFWNEILNMYISLIHTILIFFFSLHILFFSIHAYIAYLKRIANYEVGVLSLLTVLTCTLLIAELLYAHILLLLPLLVSITALLKADIDFSKRFRSKIES